MFLPEQSPCYFLPWNWAVSSALKSFNNAGTLQVTVHTMMPNLIWKTMVSKAWSIIAGLQFHRSLCCCGKTHQASCVPAGLGHSNVSTSSAFASSPGPSSTQESPQLSGDEHSPSIFSPFAAFIVSRLLILLLCFHNSQCCTLYFEGNKALMCSPGSVAWSLAFRQSASV